MNKKKIKEVTSVLASPKKIIIVPHKNPDGDAMGSCTALKLFLEKKGHHCVIISPNEYPDFLKWLPDSENVIIYDSAKKKSQKLLNESDVIFTLDFNHLGRCGELENPLKEANCKFVMIDHHQQPDDYADITYSDPAMSSTCQMVYHFIESLNSLDYITPDIATCLYTGIMTDTGSFRYRSTTALTHKVISELISYGANNTNIHQKIYDTNTLNRLQLKGVALKNLKILPKYNTAFISLSQEELNTYNYKKGDTEGFVNIGLSIEGVVFAVIFIENEQEKIIKISFRSKGNFSVNQFARNYFEGGGHTNAAGGKSDLSLTETIEKFISILPNYKNDLQ